ncbi:MAG: hypothetical protein ACREXN_02640 [Polaromonas sp.]
MDEKLLAVLIGIVAGAVGYLIATFWMKPILQYRELPVPARDPLARRDRDLAGDAKLGIRGLRGLAAVGASAQKL